MNSAEHFETAFEALTGHPPFPWQQCLYHRLTSPQHGGGQRIPSVCDIPTGLGKTAVMPIWLIALTHAWESGGEGDALPRRLVYVVNRRTIVDQASSEAWRLRARLRDPDRTSDPEAVSRLREAMGTSAARDNESSPADEVLAVSTLRGQLADNEQWFADPGRPAVICGTVDMIGSRLLFGGYRIGFKSRPLHAGFLGQDALLVHDEAHLEPAFQKLIESIQQEQQRERERAGELAWPGLRVMTLSATARGDENGQADEEAPLGLTDEEKNPPEVIPDPPTEPIHHVWLRLKAEKSLRLHPCEDEKKKLAEQIAELAAAHEGEKAAVLLFVRRVEHVREVVTELKKSKNNVPDYRIQTLTGTMRGLERDELVRKNPVFARFMPPGDRSVNPAEGTVYLVCTSAGEVGVNLSADHMVCDLSTFDSMAQRLGRVNRFGEPKEHVAKVDVVYPIEFGGKQTNAEVESRRGKTLALLKQLQGDASPKALDELPAAQRRAAFAPEPTILPATDILFDAWAMTSIREAMPGRPPLAPYLHGVADWEPPRTSVAWREEVGLIVNDEGDHNRAPRLLLDRYPPADLLEDYPIKPHETLSDRTDRVLAALQNLAKKHPEKPLWLMNAQGRIQATRLARTADPNATTEKDKGPLKQALANSTVLLPPSVGGLADGMLDSKAEQANDVADQWLDEDANPFHRRQRRFSDNLTPADTPQGMTLIRTIDTNPLADEFAQPQEDTEEEVEAESESEAGDVTTSKHRRFWHWYARPRNAEDATQASARPITWQHHTDDVVEGAKQIVSDLNLPDDLKRAVILAAQLHDLGKKRKLWQRSIGNPNPTDWHAKPGKPEGEHERRWRYRHLSDYRHEFGSLLDILHTSRDREEATSGDPETSRDGEGAENPDLIRKLENFDELQPEMRDLVLHLIAAHHGRARPHFPANEAFDPNHGLARTDPVAVETMRRYARLQRSYGRWGLAYLESLLRAADWAASATPSDAPAQGPGDWDADGNQESVPPDAASTGNPFEPGGAP